MFKLFKMRLVTLCFDKINDNGNKQAKKYMSNKSQMVQDKNGRKKRKRPKKLKNRKQIILAKFY